MRTYFLVVLFGLAIPLNVLYTWTHLARHRRASLGWRSPHVILLLLAQVIGAPVVVLAVLGKGRGFPVIPLLALAAALGAAAATATMLCPCARDDGRWT